LVLDAQLEFSLKLHHYCPTSLVVGGSFQDVNHVCFCIHRKEVNLELLFKVPPGLHGENASVHFLMENILRPLGSTTTLEKRKSSENFFLFVAELFRG